MIQNAPRRARSAAHKKAKSGTVVARTHSYTVVYQPIPADEGKGFYAHIPALGITTDGETLDAAKEMARDAIACHLDALRKLGLSIPEDVISERVEVNA